MQLTLPAIIQKIIRQKIAADESSELPTLFLTMLNNEAAITRHHIYKN